jgi:hypothetical protein
MDLTFGARLRLQRERQQVALAAIADQTKIKLSLLEGLEHDDVSRWPKGVFRRSYLRAYAQAIGLEPDALVRDFLERYPDSDEDVPTAIATARGLEAPGRRPPTRLGLFFGSAIGARAAKSAAQATSTVITADHAAIESHPPSAPEAGAFEHQPTLQQAPHVDHVPALAAPPPPVPATNRVERDLPAIAQLCTRLGRALNAYEVAPLLEDAVRIFNAVGLILWTWDARAGALMPAVGHGYSSKLIAQLPRVFRDADNAIADAFRSAQPRIVDGAGPTTGALVVPMMTPAGCSGVLALELRDGGEQLECVRALATILAAQLSTVIGYPSLGQAVNA